MIHTHVPSSPWTDTNSGLFRLSHTHTPSYYHKHSLQKKMWINPLLKIVPHKVTVSSWWFDKKKHWAAVLGKIPEMKPNICEVFYVCGGNQWAQSWEPQKEEGGCWETDQHINEFCCQEETYETINRFLKNVFCQMSRMRSGRRLLNLPVLSQRSFTR